MGKEYDTALLRRTASNLNDVEDDLRFYVERVYRDIGEIAENGLSGEYADAIEENMCEAGTLCSDCGKQLAEISHLLRLFATRLELADEKASEVIRKR